MFSRRWVVLFVAAVTVVFVAALAPVSGASVNASSTRASSVQGQSLRGKKVIALVSGDRGDRGFYQSQVDTLRGLSRTYGFKLVVVDQVPIGTAQESFTNAARQNPAILISTGAELLDGFNAVCNNPQYAGILFMTVAEFPNQCTNPAVNFDADTFQTFYMTGVAAALELTAAKQPNGEVGVVAGPDLSFAENDLASLKQGVRDQLPSATVTINYTGDFNNAALAKTAAEAFISQGARIFFPYLSGAKTAVIQAANAANLPVFDNYWNGCTVPPPGQKFAGSALGSPAPEYAKLFKLYARKSLKYNALYIAGIDTPGIGTNLCNATSSQQKVLDDTKAKLLSGAITIKAGGYIKLKDGTVAVRK